MLFLNKLIIALILIFGLTTFAQAEWITKKSDEDKKEKKDTIASWIKDKNKETITDWIKKKTKENKKKYKEKDKKISKEIKSWIKKKHKQDFLALKKLPNNANFYFITFNEQTGDIIYGFIYSNLASNKFKNTNYFKNAEGYGFIKNEKTVCSIASEIKNVQGDKINGEIGANCGTVKFNGNFEQIISKNEGSGTLSAKNGETLNFTFYPNKEEALIAFIESDDKKFFTQGGTIDGGNKEPGDDDLGDVIIGKYYALLIGNSDYKHLEPLTSPKHDVTELAKVLEDKYNFHVIKAIDATRDEIFSKFEELARKTTDKDYVLIYYSGHGKRVNNNSYWIPVNASLNSRSSWVGIKEIENFYVPSGHIPPDIKAHHLAVVADSCYFAVKGKGISSFSDNENSHFKTLLKSRTRIVMSSGSAQRVEDNKQGSRHSTFANVILTELKNNTKYIRLRKIFDTVEVALSGKQIANYETMREWGDMGGDLVFVVPKP